MIIEKDTFMEFANSWQYERAILVANNPNTSAETLGKLEISRNDMLVQFNKCIHFDNLKYTACQKTFLFNLSKDNTHFGFRNDGAPDREYAEGYSESLTYIFPFRIAGRVREFIENSSLDANVAVFDPGSAKVPVPLPKGKAPSAGYKMLCLFHHLNKGREKAGRKSAAILAVGFNAAQMVGHPSIHEIHDFRYEQDTAFSWPEVTQVL